MCTSGNLARWRCCLSPPRAVEHLGPDAPASPLATSWVIFCLMHPRMQKSCRRRKRKSRVNFVRGKPAKSQASAARAFSWFLQVAANPSQCANGEGKSGRNKSSQVSCRLRFQRLPVSRYQLAHAISLPLSGNTPELRMVIRCYKPLSPTPECNVSLPGIIVSSLAFALFGSSSRPRLRL